MYLLTHTLSFYQQHISVKDDLDHVTAEWHRSFWCFSFWHAAVTDSKIRLWNKSGFFILKENFFNGCVHFKIVLSGEESSVNHNNTRDSVCH